MSDEYLRDLLRVAVAQICQTIGYNATQATPLELLQDTVHKFLNEFARDLRRQVEHYNRTEANLNDAYLTLNSLNFNVNELLDYINNVEPVPFIVDVPKFPAHKESNLNFLKPGSKEVLTRPVHMYEHLPPTLPVESNVQPLTCGPHYMLGGNSPDKTCLSGFVFETVGGEITVANTVDVNGVAGNIIETVKLRTDELHIDEILDTSKRNKEYIALAPVFLKNSSSNTHFLDEEGRPTREISSVVMTTGGFISPAIEGKLPDAMIPDIVAKFQGFDAPPPPLSCPEIKILAENVISTTAHAKVNTEVDKESLTSKTLENVDSKKPSSATEISSTSGNVITSTTISSIDNAEVASAAGNLGGKKVIPFLYSAIHTQHTPTVASKLLKKAKKKTSNSSFPLQGKFNRSDFPGNIGAMNLSNVHHDKAQRKCMKMLQKKLSKSAKAAGGGNTMELDRSDGIFKEHINHTVLGAMSPTMEHFLIEKKKHAKQKLKFMNQLQNMVNNQQLILSTDNILPNKILTSSTSARDTKISHTSKESGNQSLFMSPSKSSSHCGTSSSRNLLDTLHIRGGKSSTNMFTNIQPINDVGPQNAVDSKEKKIPCDVKLSTEPDRSKLNIFKKISKQKGKVSPNTNKLQTTPIYTTNENKIINLPSGTTITPAPPSVVDSRHVYPPDVNDIVPVETLNEVVGLGGAQRSPSRSTVHPNISLFGTIGENIGDFVSKPKKRGRKPGSKNHVKAAGNIMSANPPIKKAKKMKVGKNIYGMYGTNFDPVTSELNTEPLNLTSSNQFGSKFAMNNQGPNPLNGQAVMQAQMKERKERKNIRMKYSPIATVTSASEHANETVKRNVNVPTKEEVNSINKKLMRMDTVLKPAPASSSLSMTSTDRSKNVSDPSKDNSPTKSPSSAPKSSGSKKRAQQRNCIIPPLFNQATTRPLFPMMPLYAFQPRPGLIPTPGLFPTATPGLFPNNPKNAAAPNMLMPSFLNFPLKALATGLSAVDLDDNDKHTEAIPQAGDRSYCNVASFVPESMKLKSPQPKTDRQTTDCESFPLTPIMRRSPTLSEVVSDAFCKQFDNYTTPDSSSVNSKSIPATPGVISLNNFEMTSTRENISSSQLPESTHGFNNSIFIPNTLSKCSTARNVHQTQSALNANDPIEVSDDSGDTPSKVLSPVLHTAKSKVNQSFIKLSPTSISLSHIDDIFTPIRDMKTIGIESATRESKKLKKSNKSANKNMLTSPTMLPLEMFGAEKGGKLAGGADLIPLVATGLAYSSKTIPSTSLTAPSTPRYPIHKNEFNIFSNLTLTPHILTTADLQKKRKEHKKMKKLKDGKIKKKKDKKDKTKSRERNEKYLHKTEKLNKGTEKVLLKKLKKEKKKEKQRITIDSLAEATILNMTNQSFPSQSLFDTAASENLRNVSSITSSSASTLIPLSSTGSIAAVASSFVPKLTLKFGNCQSPTSADDSTAQKLKQIATVSTSDERVKREPSPELARISPLVTRPPKQKIGSGDAPTLHSIALNAASTTTNSSNSEYLTDNSKGIVPSNVVTSTHLSIPPPSPWLSEGTLSASSVLLPQQLLKTTKTHEHPYPSTSIITTPSTDASVSATSVSLVRPTDRQSPVPLISEANRPSSYIDAEGNRVWICPACGKVDDGSAMIGCDGCDAWYHWVCVGIFVAPKDNEDWFCRVCITRKKGIHSTDRKRKRNKKK